MSEDGQIIGTYIHGLFEEKDSLESILHWVSGKHIDAESWRDVRERELERLADCYEKNLNIDALCAAIS